MAGDWDPDSLSGAPLINGYGVTTMIRVLLADDHSIVRDGLRRIVEESEDIEVVAEAADGKEAILVLTMHEEEQYVVRAIESGAMGYITKRSAPEQLLKAIRRVHAGFRYLTDQAAELLALRVARGTAGQSPLESLSMRELQVLRRLALGHTNREIAESYCISIKTVDTYRSRLLKKLNLRNNAELSRFAIQNRLIEP